MPLDPAELTTRFTYHAPKPGQTQIYEELRFEGKALAELIDRHVPEGREKALAFTKLEEAIFWANAAVARRG